MQNLAVVVVNINPKIRLVIAGSQIQCLVESFAVFPERAAWPCEGVNWIQSDYPVLSLGCTYFHRLPRWLGSSLSTLASARKQAENPAHPSVVPDLCFLSGRSVSSSQLNYIGTLLSPISCQSQNTLPRGTGGQIHRYLNLGNAVCQFRVCFCRHE